MSKSKCECGNLISYRSKWHSRPTRTIRVPVALADAILEFSHGLDNSLSQATDKDSIIVRVSISGDFEGVEDGLPPEMSYPK